MRPSSQRKRSRLSSACRAMRPREAIGFRRPLRSSSRSRAPSGSIGVLGGKFNVAPATQKIYLNSGAVSRGANVEMFDEFTDFTPGQMKIFQDQMLGDTYQRFVKLVADSRHLSVPDTEAIAQGRVWMGDQAAHLKLVDQLGGFSDALEAAKKAAKLPLDHEVA